MQFAPNNNININRLLTPEDKSSFDSKTNLQNLENVDSFGTDLETIRKIGHFILKNKEQGMSPETWVKLDQYEKKLNNEIRKIKSETSGIAAFFRYFFFNSKEKNEKLNQLQYMEALRNFIDANKISMQHVRGELAFPAKEKIPADKAQKELIDEHNEPEAPKAAPLPEPRKLSSQILGVLTDTIGRISNLIPEENPQTPEALTSDFLPPPPGAPPPPPMHVAENVKILSPEEKYYQLQTKKIENQLKERANPAKFYIVNAPKDQAKLEQRKKDLETDIQRWTQVTKTDLSDLAQRTIEEKKKAIERIDEELKGTIQPINISMAGFKEKIRQYTNEELKLLIGMLFDGQVPTEDHPNFTTYKNNKDLLDGIFRDWKQLSKGVSGQAFLVHQQEWSRYLGTNIFGVIDTLRKRNLSDKHVEYMKETKYEIPPYSAEKKPGQRKEILQKEPAKSSSVTDELNARLSEGLNLRKVDPSEKLPPLPDPPSEREKMLREIEKRRKPTDT